LRRRHAKAETFGSNKPCGADGSGQGEEFATGVILHLILLY